MCQQHPEGNLVAAWILACELSNDRSHWHIKIEQAALIKQHRHAGGGHDFRDGGQIEERFGRGWLRFRVVGEMAEGAKRNQIAEMGHGNRGARKRSARHCIFQNPKRVGETIVLIVVLGRKTGYRVRKCACQTRTFQNRPICRDFLGYSKSDYQG